MRPLERVRSFAAAPSVRLLWENRRAISGTAAGVIGGLWVFCGLAFEEPFAFLVGVAILTPLVGYGALLAATAFRELRPAPVPATAPVPDDREREERRETRRLKKS